jgi:hypothetical protein
MAAHSAALSNYRVEFGPHLRAELDTIFRTCPPSARARVPAMLQALRDRYIGSLRLGSKTEHPDRKADGCAWE